MAASLSSKGGGFAAGAEDALACIFSCSGVTLTPEEKCFFKESNPFGFILFGRNIENPNQLKALTDDLKNAVGRECPILIDQEGGRVQRLKPPLWRKYPAMREFGEQAANDIDGAIESLRFVILQIAEELRASGINVNCAPVLDVLTAETHDAIGDRAFSSDPEIVARLGLAVSESFLEAGITPVIKHIPGHGRATMDTHYNLPFVIASKAELEEIDFKPFKKLSKTDASSAIWGMTAHIIYETYDAERPVTISPSGIKAIIRDQIGFDGFLLSDDLDMKALDKYGDIPERCRLTLKAGADAALYCWADLKIMEKIANSGNKLGEGSLKRLQRAAEFRKLAA